MALEKNARTAARGSATRQSPSTVKSIATSAGLPVLACHASHRSPIAAADAGSITHTAHRPSASSAAPKCGRDSSDGVLGRHSNAAGGSVNADVACDIDTTTGSGESSGRPSRNPLTLSRTNLAVGSLSTTRSAMGRRQAAGAGVLKPRDGLRIRQQSTCPRHKPGPVRLIHVVEPAIVEHRLDLDVRECFRPRLHVSAASTGVPPGNRRWPGNPGSPAETPESHRPACRRSAPRAC